MPPVYAEQSYFCSKSSLKAGLKPGKLTLSYSFTKNFYSFLLYIFLWNSHWCCTNKVHKVWLTLLLLWGVALLTSTANVTQSLSSSFSRAIHSGNCDNRIRRRSAILRSISLEETRGFLRRQTEPSQRLKNTGMGKNKTKKKLIRLTTCHHFSALTWAAVLNISQEPRLWEEMGKKEL